MYEKQTTRCTSRDQFNHLYSDKPGQIFGQAEYERVLAGDPKLPYLTSTTVRFSHDTYTYASARATRAGQRQERTDGVRALIDSDSPSLEYDSIRGMSTLAFFASFLGRGFQDSNADDFVGELTTSTIFLSTSIFLENFSCKPITIL
jgi:hypothetical protein